MKCQHRQLTDAEFAALASWRLYCIIGLVLIGCSYLMVLLYVCLASDRNWVLVWFWFFANMMLCFIGARVANRIADRIVESLPDETTSP